MTSLDAALARWANTPASDLAWGPLRAKAVADQTAQAGGLTVLWEPGDEEWILLADQHAYRGMISIKYPLALMTSVAAGVLRNVDPGVEVVEITDFLDENLSADPDLLKATALPSGWDDDFNTQAFCANDLFVESV